MAKNENILILSALSGKPHGQRRYSDDSGNVLIIRTLFTKVWHNGEQEYKPESGKAYDHVSHARSSSSVRPWPALAVSIWI
jgi:hypothetical protein